MSFGGPRKRRRKMGETSERLDLRRGMDLLHEIEQNFPVAEWRVADIRVWPIVRVRLGYGLAYESEGLNGPTSNVGLLASGRRLFASGRRLASSVRSKVRPTAVAGSASDRRGSGVARGAGAVFLADGSSFVLDGSVLVDRQLDCLRAELQQRGVRSVLLVPGSPVAGLRPPVINIQFRLDRSMAGARLRRAPRCDLAGYGSIRSELAGAGLEQYLPSPKAIRLAGAVVGAWADRFEVIFDDESAGVGFLSEFYSLRGMAFVLACARREIPSVDVQHGLQGPLHFAYGPWRRQQDRYELLPTHFAVWSELEAADIRSWAGDQHQVDVVGNPFLDRRLGDDDPELASGDAAFARLSSKSGATRHVLVTLSGIENVEEREWLRELIAVAPKQWFWWVRCHPKVPSIGIWEQTLACVAGQVDVRRASTLPLFVLLRNVDAHVTRSSSVFLDALRFGVPSVVTDLTGVAIFGRHLDGCHAAAAVTGDVHEVIAALERLTTHRTADDRAPADHVPAPDWTDWLFELVSNGGDRR